MKAILEKCRDKIDWYAKNADGNTSDSPDPDDIELLHEINDAISAASRKAVAWRFRHSLSEKWHYDDFPNSWWEVQPLYLHPVTVTDEDVERAKQAWYTYGISENERFRAALSSFANKENRND